MGAAVNVFLVGLAGIGYYTYTTIDPTRADYPKPADELYAKVVALPNIPNGVKTLYGIHMNQFGIRRSSDPQKSVTWTFTFKDQIYGEYTVNFVPNGEASTTTYAKMKEFEPELEGNPMTSGDWNVLRAIARDVTFEQVYSALNDKPIEVSKVRKVQGRILSNVGTVNRLKKINEGDVGAKIQEVQERAGATMEAASADPLDEQ
jgi:hypothetical protein